MLESCHSPMPGGLGGLRFQGLLVQPPSTPRGSLNLRLGDPGSERLRALFLAVRFPCRTQTPRTPGLSTSWPPFR